MHHLQRPRAVGRLVCPYYEGWRRLRPCPASAAAWRGMSPPEVFVGRAWLSVGESRTHGCRGGQPRAAARSRDGHRRDHSRALRPVRSESKIVINEAEKPGRLLGAMQQIAMSAAAVGTDVSFYRPPQVRMQFDGVLSPSGSTGELKGMQITTNPLIPRKVDQMVEDRDAARPQPLPSFTPLASARITSLACLAWDYWARGESWFPPAGRSPPRTT